MKKNKLKVLVLAVAIIMLFSTLSFAAEVTSLTSNDQVVNTSSEYETTPISEGGNETTTSDNSTSNWTNSDLYKWGDTFTVDGIIDGNAFLMGKDITISGEIGGDTFVFADKVTIDGGYVYSNLFVVANKLVINGIVYDVYGVADSFTLGEDGYVYRDMRVAANIIDLSGKVRRNAYITTSQLNLNTDNGTVIGGNLEYSSTSEFNIPDGAIQGEVKFNQETSEEKNVGEIISSYIIKGVNALFYVLVVVLLAIWLAPKFVDKVTKMDTKKSFISLGVGILTAIVSIIVLCILLFSGVFLNIFAALTMLFVVICMSGLAFASVYFGSLFAKLVKWNKKSLYVVSCLIVALVLWLLSQIPYIGWLIGILTSLFGIGSLVFNLIFKEKTSETVEVKTEE